MNIDEKFKYIEEHSDLEIKTKWITLTLTLPFIEDPVPSNPKVVLYLEDITQYLEHKNITYDTLFENSSVNNTHPTGRIGTWVFRHSNKIPGAKKKRTGVSMKNKTVPKKKTNKEV